MFSKIFSSFKLAGVFKGLILKRLTNPLQSSRIVNLLMDIKNIFQSSKGNADALCLALDLLVDFKNKYPEDFDEIFEIVKELLQDYKQNSDDIKQNIKELFK
ncbi:hypothetical protein CAUP111243_05425 [Campylobacter upsaliensis]|uniref:Uncharacterized protein n=1 Tax=Campylobacter upsaliensis TaxID=28080 RepID=A0A3S4U6D4_CAMUP|nr:Uncharacterised protein [Campylobacter upsaliensis]